MLNICEINFKDNVIKEKREEVRSEFVSKFNNSEKGIITKLIDSDLKTLFYLYDEIFLNNYFINNLKGNVKFSLSTKMTSCAGKTIFPRKIVSLKLENVVFEIRIGINFFLSYYDTNGEKIVSGIKTKDALEAFQIVFEHEICHLIELIEFKASSCKKDRFKLIMKNIFGHTDVYHKLPRNRDIARMKYGFNLGMRVVFNYNNEKVNGIIYNINKRATVMVKNPDGNFIDSSGNRYLKYYVPLNDLVVIN